MSRDLIKGYRAVMADRNDVAIIDTNELIAKKLEALQKTSEQGFQAWGDSFPGVEAVEDVSALFEENGTDAVLGEDGGDFSDGEFHGGILKAAPAKPVYEGPSPEELIAQAQDEIEQMRLSAQQEIEEYRQQVEQAAYDEGMRNGYNAGKEQALQEMQVLKEEVAQERLQLEEQYNRLLSEMEPQFIEMLTPIYEHVIGASLSEDEQFIRLLIGNALAGISGAREFLIHVSAEDYPAVREDKNYLATRTGLQDVRVEVVSDATMSQGQCTIETENGIYDCSIGTQLGELRKRLKILSYGN